MQPTHHNRPGLKEDLGRILDVVDALGIPILAVPGVEADDVIGTMAAKGVSHGMDVTIVSPDKVRRGRPAGRWVCTLPCLASPCILHPRCRTTARPPPPPQDFFQLLGPRVRLMRMIKAPKKVSLHPGSPFYTVDDFEAEHQLGDPRLWADVMALQVGGV
jgi:hypothetical protein